MQVRTMQGVQVLRRVRDFLLANEIPVALGSLAKPVEELSGIIDRLSTHAVEQDSRDRAAKAATRGKARLLEVLRLEYLRPIALTGTTLFPNDQDMQRALQMPPFRDHERILAAAYAMLDRVAPHKELFLGRGFAPDFLERFKKAADDFKQAIDGRSADVGHRSAATVGQLEELRRGRRLVRLLNAMVAPRLVGQPDKAAAWASLARFRPVPVGEAPAAGEGPVAGGEVKVA